MKFRSLTSLAGALFVLVAAALLTSCGGGGASGNPNLVPSVQMSLNPNTPTIYAGVPFTFQIVGGRPPYLLTSSEPGILPVPSQVTSNSFDVVAANPGVVDDNIQAGALPVRTINLTVRSGDGQTAGTPVKVAQNFLTGYGVVFSPLTCPIPTSATSVQACAGGETAVRFAAVFNGALNGDRQFRLTVMKGPFAFVFPQGGTGDTVLVNSDHSGIVNAILQVTAGVPTQIAVLRVQDVATGVYTDFAFTITGVGNNGKITALPGTLTFTGNLTTDCGVGSANILVFDGTPPYTALSSNPAISVSPTQSNSNPGQFTVSVGTTSPPCPTGTVVITDALGARTSVDVTSKPGSQAPPTPPSFDVQPTSITLACAQSGSVTAVGGSGSYSANSTNPNVTVTISGNTITISRLGPAGPGTGTQTTTVSVTDGSAIKTVDVTSPLTCP